MLGFLLVAVAIPQMEGTRTGVEHCWYIQSWWGRRSYWLLEYFPDPLVPLSFYSPTLQTPQNTVHFPPQFVPRKYFISFCFWEVNVSLFARSSHWFILDQYFVAKRDPKGNAVVI